MKVLLLFISLVFSSLVQAQVCGPQQFRAWTQTRGYFCVNQYPTVVNDCYMCQMNYQATPYLGNWFNGFPAPIYQPQTLPWWAYQGNFHYPNLHYPGAWNYPGINAHHYPGQGEVFAAKPNVYVESIHKDKKFTFSFGSKEDLSFLATTPVLDDKNTWRGKIFDQDKFEVEDVNYDYLFYDIRLPKEKMQFERGLCATREETIKWMLKDLEEMKYPAVALQDFEEHWKVKIPDYPFYCIYPQYTEQLDAALPVNISLEQTRFIRSLFILIPHKEAPDVDVPQNIPLPVLDPQEIRPVSIIKHENNFREWGVAFLGE
jgi:hypothetical protein